MTEAQIPFCHYLFLMNLKYFIFAKVKKKSNNIFMYTWYFQKNLRKIKNKYEDKFFISKIVMHLT